MRLEDDLMLLLLVVYRTEDEKRHFLFVYAFGYRQGNWQICVFFWRTAIYVSVYLYIQCSCVPWFEESEVFYMKNEKFYFNFTASMRMWIDRKLGGKWMCN